MKSDKIPPSWNLRMRTYLYPL